MYLDTQIHVAYPGPMTVKRKRTYNLSPAAIATVKRLVESHGGSLGVGAGTRGGALFWFELDEAAPSEPVVHETGALRSA